MTVKRALWHSLLGLLILILLCSIFFAIDYMDGTTTTEYVRPIRSFVNPEVYENPIVWAPLLSGFAFILVIFYIFYIIAPRTIYHYTKSHGRNTVRWVTVFVVFTPIIGTVAYLLTWPKKQR